MIEQPRIAFGPELPEFGSWQWVGADLARELARSCRTTVFQQDVPLCDAVVFVKFKPSADRIAQLSRRSAVLYAPVDYYGSAAEIDADGAALRCCDRIVIHCERLRKHFAPYAPVEYVDHHIKFTSPLRETYVSSGPIVWIGVRSNLPPLVQWVNRHRLPEELWILTNPEDERAAPNPTDFGFRPGRVARMEVWTEHRHREWTALARAALDIKGSDFRAQHKPPAKAIDFLASGLPLAMNRDSSSAEHLHRLGFDLATPEAPDWWLSREYADQTVRFGRLLRDLLALPQIGRRYREILDDVLIERTARTSEKLGGDPS